MNSTLIRLAAIACLALPALAHQTGAPADDVAELVRRGRELISDGRAEEALPLFEEAVVKDGGLARTRVWLIRCQIGRGYLNDALEATDDLAEAGEEGPAMDYLYGMALCHRAKEYIVQGVGGQMIDMNFRDSLVYLQAATTADPDTFWDAYLPMAEAGWYAQELTLARAAADRAATLRPRGLDEQYTLGRIALSQYVAANADPERGEEAQSHWKAAKSAFESAITNGRPPYDAARRARVARAHLQLAYTYQWKGIQDNMLASYSNAMALDPGAVDFDNLWTLAPTPAIEQCLATGLRKFGQNHPGESNGTIVWWLGYARFVQQRYAEAEKEFQVALKLLPDYVPSHWYIALCRYHRSDFQGAIDSLSTLFDLDPETAITMTGSDRELNLAVLAYLVGQCELQERKLEAAQLSEMHVGVDPTDALWWSYVGLFWRDAGDQLRASTDPADVESRQRYWERAWEGYEIALQLDPENPAYLNDGAVVLHYNLHRNLDTARSMYARAQARALEELAREDLPADLREVYETARIDSRNNLRRLDEGSR